MTANLAGFRQQMRAILAEGKKEEVDFLNKRCVQVLIGSKNHPGAVALTQKATAAQIRKDLNRKYGVGTKEVITRGKNKGQLSRTTTWISKPTKLLWLLAAKMLVKQGITLRTCGSFSVWNARIAEAALRIASARDQSRAYLAAGWLAAVRAMGYTRRSDTNRSLRPVGSSKGTIGYGSLATKTKLKFEAYNNAAAKGPRNRPGNTEAIITKALNESISGQRKDMEEYLAKKLEEAGQKHADKH